jgi:hypothetical protein
VLDGTADPAGQVEVRGDLGAGLADLLGVRAPALRGHHAGDPDHAAEQRRQFLKRGEPIGAADTPAASDHHPGGRQRRAARAGRRLHCAHRQVAAIHRRRDPVNRDGRRSHLGRNGGDNICRHGEQGDGCRKHRFLKQQPGPPLPDDRVLAAAVIHSRRAVRRQRQRGDRAQVRKHLVAPLGPRRHHRVS